MPRATQVTNVPTHAPGGAAATTAATTHTLERALTILRAFGGRTTPLSHSELVRRTGYSKASVSRIAFTLVALGYLARDADGVRFRIGLRGPSLGHTYRANSPLASAVHPIMRAFADRHDLSVALGIADGTDMMYVEYCKSPSTSTLCFAVGRRLPMDLCAIGRAWLWSRPEDERDLLLERIAALPRTRPVKLDNTRHAFAHLEEHGWCTAAGEYHRDVWGVAMPVQLGDPGMSMGLSCAGMLPTPCDRQLREQIAPALQETAQHLREALAGVDSGLF